MAQRTNYERGFNVSTVLTDSPSWFASLTATQQLGLQMLLRHRMGSNNAGWIERTTPRQRRLMYVAISRLLDEWDEPEPADKAKPSPPGTTAVHAEMEPPPTQDYW